MVAEVVAPRIKLRYVHTWLCYWIQVFVQTLLGCELSRVREMVEQLVRLLLAVVKIGVTIVPFHSVEVTWLDVVLGPDSLFLSFAISSQFEKIVSCIVLEHDEVVYFFVYVAPSVHVDVNAKSSGHLLLGFAIYILSTPISEDVSVPFVSGLNQLLFALLSFRGSLDLWQLVYFVLGSSCVSDNWSCGSCGFLRWPWLVRHRTFTHSLYRAQIEALSIRTLMLKNIAMTM